ncbi:lysophospholipid acyltransferase family protein [Octadecabacter sp. 1_MG-2023]|uniref:lysophospholipid acyltransferase family protein n=1 Tax=unclassified Octadecabacter TaxID=196158 RepID=UPI001C0A2EEA|nr:MULTISPECIES: lysophospholipid acyltransferase family protein [unclassified Octadecabacter]MBU2993458.1 lysophospholipid acyltransferase family protein [Octadecabacter sp. B2R22]MDO6733086.1 lysophospholipid acyltransferase family protein [Octadecabacter sp. 1_MG-2023]
MPKNEIARDISYAHSAATRRGRALIRVMENATGRLRLIRKARGYDAEVANGADFWRVMTERYKINIKVIGGSLETIPEDGPLIVVANHPYGILDGMTLGRILSERRGGDFKILANSVFRKSPDLARVVLPVSFDETKEAAKLNLDTRKEALRYLGAGGAVGVFPGGTVSTSARPFSKPMDPQWRNFTAKMVAKSDAVVVPVFFEGTNSRAFQLASHLHTTLRMGLLVREFKARVGSDVCVVIGKPIPVADLEPYKSDATACMDFLRKATYELSPNPLATDVLGHEFDAKYKRKEKS